jgi:quercetin dioxygenase-like cupin family protein
MPLPDRLRTELGRYRIGPKLRVLRLHRSMGLLQLGERTGLSPSLLSRIENNKHLPTVPTLLRIALVFNVTLDHFFRNEQRQRVVSITRREERQQAVSGDPAGNDGCLLSKLDLGPGERKFHPYLAEFLPGRRARPHTHEGFEFIYVLRGTLAVLVGTEEIILLPGDSVYFDSNLRHTYKGLGEETCTALMVCADPGRNLAERRMDRLEDLHVVGRQAQATNAGVFPQTSSTAHWAEQEQRQPLPGGNDHSKTSQLPAADGTPAAATNGKPPASPGHGALQHRPSSSAAKRKAK